MSPDVEPGWYVLIHSTAPVEKYAVNGPHETPRDAQRWMLRFLDMPAKVEVPRYTFDFGLFYNDGTHHRQDGAPSLPADPVDLNQLRAELS